MLTSHSNKSIYFYSPKICKRFRAVTVKLATDTANNDSKRLNDTNNHRFLLRSYQQTAKIATDCLTKPVPTTVNLFTGLLKVYACSEKAGLAKKHSRSQRIY